MDDKKSFSFKCGEFIGNILVGAITASLSVMIVGLAIRFMIWIWPV